MAINPKISATDSLGLIPIGSKIGCNALPIAPEIVPALVGSTFVGRLLDSQRHSIFLMIINCV